jgi:hypothetical protein
MRRRSKPPGTSAGVFGSRLRPHIIIGGQHLSAALGIVNALPFDLQLPPDALFIAGVLVLGLLTLRRRGAT